MKVKELLEILQNCNSEADVLLCYEHVNEDKRAKCYYADVDDIGYNQHLNESKTSVVVDEDKLLIWAK